MLDRLLVRKLLSRKLSGCARSDIALSICILYFLLCTLMRNNKSETINGKQQTTNCQLHKTSRYNSLALGCSRITRSDSSLHIRISYFLLCTLTPNNKSAITNSSITTAYCQQDCASWNFRSTYYIPEIVAVSIVFTIDCQLFFNKQQHILELY